jgi:hypothetical protein
MDSPDLAAQLLADSEFVSDLARYSEKLLTEKFIRRKYNLTDDAWETLADNDELVEAIETEKLRRIRNGSAKREKAQQLITKGPDILDKILSDESANPRHRVDAVKALDAIAEPGPQATPAMDRFIITIDLGEDQKLMIDKPRKPGLEDNKIIEGTTSQTMITDGSKWKE